MYFVPFSFITNLISGVLKTVINIFFSVLVLIVPTLVEVILALLQEILNAFLYEMLFLPLLYILETLQEAVEIFAGIRNVTYFGARDNLYNIVLFRSGLSTAFWAITLIGLIIAVTATILSLSKAGKEEKYTISAILGRLGRTCLTFLMVPFVTICCINLTSLVFIKAGEMIEMTSGYGGNITIQKILFATTTMGAEKHTAPSEGGLLGGARAPYFTGAKDYKSTFHVFGQGKELDPNRSEGMELDGTKDDNMNQTDKEVEAIKNTKKYPGGDFNISTMNVALGIILALYFIILYCAAILLFLMRLLEIALLYTVSPLFTGSIPFDDGEKFGNWREVFIAKLVSGFGLILGMKIYTIIVMPLIMDPNIRFAASSETADMVLRIILLAGFGFAAYKCFSILTHIVNPQLAYTEAEGVARVVTFAMGGLGAAARTARSVTGDQQRQMMQISQKQDSLKQ